ncbi:MAG TPA: hypothetical protein VF122_04555 [Caulobacteraceae bacterium]
MVAAQVEVTRGRTGYFYVWMAGLFVVIAFGGFAPTYWLQLSAGTFVGPPLLHIHGLMFSAWTLFLLSQTSLAAMGRLEHHRAWGLAGIALASAMVVVGAAVAIERVRHGLADGYAEQSLRFMILPISAVTLFGVFITAAIANIKRPDWHKRFMLIATIFLLEAALARVFMVLNAGMAAGARPGLGPPPPIEAARPASAILAAIMLLGVIYDWRTRGRPHPAWLIGIAALAATALLRGPVSASEEWQAFAYNLAHIAG